MMDEKMKRELEELESEYRGINEGFRIASEKLEALKALAPEILSWMQTGVSWACSECSEGRGGQR